METDDIVTRIRATAAEGFSVTDWTKLSWDMQEAADEIERLRETVEHWKGKANALMDWVLDLKEQLRHFDKFED
jgi:hypothetical protein